jgi:hypothetical protein
MATLVQAILRSGPFASERCPAPPQYVSMLLKGRSGGCLVESLEQVLYGCDTVSMRT